MKFTVDIPENIDVKTITNQLENLCLAAAARVDEYGKEIIEGGKNVISKKCEPEVTATTGSFFSKRATRISAYFHYKSFGSISQIQILKDIKDGGDYSLLKIDDVTN